MHTQIAIYSDNIHEDKTKIIEVFHHFKNQNDVVVITDNINDSEYKDYAVFPSFYTKFFQGTVIFLHLEDYLEYKDTIIGSPKILLDPKTAKNIDTSLVKRSNFFTLTKDVV